MIYQAVFVIWLLTACTPREVAVMEELTEEAIIVEKQLFDPPNPNEQIAAQ